MGIIFDLDQTLVDSKVVEPYRQQRDWGTVRRLIPQIQPYPGILEVMTLLASRQIPVAIVTNAPSFYLEAILKNLGWSVCFSVCFHDVPRGQHKPHPAPIQKAVAGLGVPLASVHSFGDRAIDITASKRAGVKAIGCLWGCEEVQELADSSPDLVLETTEVLRSYIRQEFTTS